MAKRFTLLFGWVNHPGLREALTRRIQEAIPGSIQVELKPSQKAGIVLQMEEALGETKPPAVLVSGFERVSAEAVAGWNLNRNYFAKRFPFPFVFWMRSMPCVK